MLVEFEPEMSELDTMSRSDASRASPSGRPPRFTGAGILTPRTAYICALLLVAISFALYASSPLERPWMAGNNDPADYRFVAEYFWGVPTVPITYAPRWNGGWGAYLRTVPFRGIGLGTMYLLVAWLRMGHAPLTPEEVIRAGIALATVEKIVLAVALVTVFTVVRRRWGAAVALVTLAVTAFPSHYWRMCDDFIAEPVERIVFLLAFACAVAMGERKSAQRWAWALIALFFYAAHVKVQWYVGAFLLLPILLTQLRAAGVGLKRSVLLCTATVSIPLGVMAVNWIGWRTTSLSPGIGIHVNLKYHGDVLREFSAKAAREGIHPAFTDPTRPKLNWWSIYVGADVRREDYEAFDRYARDYVRAHPKMAFRGFWEGVGLASTLPAVQRMQDGNIRLTSLDEPWLALVRGGDLAVWVLLIVGLRFAETRMPCALALVLWVVPALGNVVSLYELRYHVPMAGLGAAAACLVAVHIVRIRQDLRLLVPSPAVQ